MVNDFAILLLSHDLDYSFEARKFLTESFPHVHLRLTRNEGEAMQYVEGIGVYGNRFCYPFPDLVMVDTEHVYECELGFVQWMSSHPRFGTLPLALLSSQSNNTVVQRAFEAGVNCFVVKRDQQESLRELIDGVLEVKEFWSSGRERLPKIARVSV